MLTGQPDHLGRDVEADDAPKVIGQRSGDATKTAAEIEGQLRPEGTRATCSRQ
jgi:hypothetical protein